MAEKYVDISATYNGDGTLSTPASADGQPGAWNDLLAVCALTPLYGSVADGDLIHIRTHDGMNDLGIALAAALTFNGSTDSTSVITYLFDDGTVWSTGGLFLFTCGGQGVVVGSYALVSGKNRNVKFHFTATSDNDSQMRVNSYGVANDFIYYTDISSVYRKVFTVGSTSSYPGVASNGYFDLGAYDGNGALLGTNASYSKAIYINPVINVDRLPNSSSILIFGSHTSSAYGLDVNVLGGKIENSKELQRLWSSPGVDGRRNTFTCVGFDPGIMNTEEAIQVTRGVVASVSHMGPNFADFFYRDEIGDIRFISGKNYPTLNAVLPDGSNTAWSYKVYPSGASPGRPLVLPYLLKWYNLASATKTITIEMLLSEGFVSPTKYDVHASIAYIDTSGELQTLSTLDAGPLATSAAGWTTDYYGDKNYNKYKIAVTTPTAIKQNSYIKVQILFGLRAQTTTDFMFVDPEVLLT
jgi:hypothetical protein